MRTGAAIRAAERRDAEGIAVVHVESWRAAYHGLLPQSVLDGLSVERRAAGWRTLLSAAGGTTLVATEPDTERVVGFIDVGPSRDEDVGEATAEVRALYVMSEWWDTGTGGRLHDAGVELLTREFDRAMLWVLDTNQRGRRFYELRGWRTDGATKREDIGEFELCELRYWLDIGG